MKKAELTITVEQARTLEQRGVKFKGATIHQTLGPNFREIVWMTSSPNLGKRCYVCDTHTVFSLREMLRNQNGRVDLWYVQVIRENGHTDRYFFKTAMDVVLSGQKTWHGVRGVYKDVTDDKIEFCDKDRNVILFAIRLTGEVQANAINF